MVELLKQPQYKPYDVNDEVLSIFTGSKGFLDDLPLNRVAEFEAGLLKHMHDEFPEFVKELNEKKDLPGELEKKIMDVVAKFKARFGK